MFELHPQLINDTVVVGNFRLSLLLLHKDGNYPWCILVPKREDVREVHQLAPEDQIQLLSESIRLAGVMEDLYAPDKLNIASLGNLVPQLHIHHIARFTHDACWPKPVWGQVPPVPYTQDALDKRLEQLRYSLQGDGFTAHV